MVLFLCTATMPCDNICLSTSSGLCHFYGLCTLSSGFNRFCLCTSSLEESLRRYTHYFERFRCHDQGQRVACDETMQILKRKMVVLQKEFGHAEGLEFLEDAIRQIIDCRRMLKWSFAFGYFSFAEPSARKDLFEFHQGMLEQHLDTLQELTEQLEPKTFTTGGTRAARLERLENFKTKLIDLTRVVGGFFRQIGDVFEHEMGS
eukprot:GHVT01101268.1.p1 GENE.GHVT01101268.1~~GHVT01101268.1.p1  ORF type:complete len:204 (-),score=26.28 GHVT01101268.1:586-1197(-)